MNMNRFGIEDNTTEFKVTLNDKLEREVVAFLNSEKGGGDSQCGD